MMGRYVRWSPRYLAWVIANDDGTQAYSDSVRPLVFTSERDASEWLALDSEKVI